MQQKLAGFELTRPGRRGSWGGPDPHGRPLLPLPRSSRSSCPSLESVAEGSRECLDATSECSASEGSYSRSGCAGGLLASDAWGLLEATAALGAGGLAESTVFRERRTLRKSLHAAAAAQGTDPEAMIELLPSMLDVGGDDDDDDDDGGGGGDGARGLSDEGMGGGASNLGGVLP
eukprot:2931482-Prymnesium_polylepis.1